MQTQNDVPSLTPANGPPRREEGGSERGSAPMRDPIGPFSRGVLELFRGPLASVRFPDADRASLESLAEACHAAQLELEAIEVALESARARVRAADEALTDHASRALAYARVFADGHPELEDALAALPSTSKSEPRERDPKLASSSGQHEGEAPKRRGRPRKQIGEPLLSIDAEC